MRRRTARRGRPPRTRRGGSRDPATSGRCFKRPGRGGPSRPCGGKRGRKPSAPASACPGTTARAGRRCTQGASARSATQTRAPGGATTTCRGTAKPCRGLKISGAAYIGPYRTRFNVARTHVGTGGLRPMEAAGACFEHPGKWLASIRNAADYNNAARPGARKPAGETSPLQSGFPARLPQPRRRAS